MNYVQLLSEIVMGEASGMILTSVLVKSKVLSACTVISIWWTFTLKRDNRKEACDNKSYEYTVPLGHQSTWALE
jgi:hypothetical protein